MSRRRLLQVAGGTVGSAALASSATAAPDGVADSTRRLDRQCPETTVRPSTVHYDDSVHGACDDDHPRTRELQLNVADALTGTYSTVGSLVDAGFVPYLDFFAADATWAHWLNPAFVADDAVLDPERPEAVLVDHEYWRPFGVMFVAARDGDRVDPPPAVYEDEDGACTPWHAHVGLPGRYAWSKFQATYQTDATFPCRTPWVMHIWRYDSEESVYAHHAPENRGGPPAEPAGFETDVDTSEEPLAPEHLPDALRERCEEIWGDVGDQADGWGGDLGDELGDDWGDDLGGDWGSDWDGDLW